MTREEQKQLDDLRLSINNLTVNFTELALRCEALRALLVKHDVFSETEYNEKLASLRAQWLAVLDEKIDEQKAEVQTRLRQFLESIEGPKH